MKGFEEGDKIHAIYFPDEQQISLHTECLELGRVESITVVMENGQMAAVPWFEVVYSSGHVCKYNGALVEGVCINKKDLAND